MLILDTRTLPIFWLLFWCIFSIAAVQSLEDGNEWLPPKIWVTEENDLHFRSAHDQDIIFRLKEETSGLHVNEMNLMDIVQRFRQQRLDLQNVSNTVLSQQMSFNDLKHNVKNMYDDVIRFGRHLRFIDNRTRLTINPRMIRRILGRIRRLDQRLTLIEQNLLIDNCSTNVGSASVCKNGGVCYDAFNDFTCDCPKGWTVSIITAMI